MVVLLAVGEDGIRVVMDEMTIITPVEMVMGVVGAVVVVVVVVVVVIAVAVVVIW